jgi:hypothetical protein
VVNLSGYGRGKAEAESIVAGIRNMQALQLKTLRRESREWNRRMNRDRIQINWTFDRRAARRKFGYKRKAFKRSPT